MPEIEIDLRKETFTAREIEAVSGGAIAPATINQWIARGQLKTPGKEPRAGKPRQYSHAQIYEILFMGRMSSLGISLDTANSLFFEAVFEKEKAPVIVWGDHTSDEPQLFKDFDTTFVALINEIGSNGGWFSIYHFIKEIDEKLIYIARYRHDGGTRIPIFPPGPNTGKAALWGADAELMVEDTEETDGIS